MSDLIYKVIIHVHFNTFPYTSIKWDIAVSQKYRIIRLLLRVTVQLANHDQPIHWPHGGTCTEHRSELYWWSRMSYLILCAKSGSNTTQFICQHFIFSTIYHQITACVYGIYNRKYTILSTIIHASISQLVRSIKPVLFLEEKMVTF